MKISKITRRISGLHEQVIDELSGLIPMRGVGLFAILTSPSRLLMNTKQHRGRRRWMAKGKKWRKLASRDTACLANSCVAKHIRDNSLEKCQWAKSLGKREEEASALATLANRSGIFARTCEITAKAPRSIREEKKCEGKKCSCWVKAEPRDALVYPTTFFLSLIDSYR
ncbi:hypothetical protein KM043_010921 [Ampulex compressa]|nr:hypothetical protein KM043_010921 [Ampulex compressa]